MLDYFVLLSPLIDVETVNAELDTNAINYQHAIIIDGNGWGDGKQDGGGDGFGNGDSDSNNYKFHYGDLYSGNGNGQGYGYIWGDRG